MQRLRVICGTIARISLEPDVFLLVINWPKEGVVTHPILSPVSGALTAEPAGFAWLKKHGAYNFEPDGSLQFDAPKAKIQQIRSWFERGLDRETSPNRIVRQQLQGLTPAETTWAGIARQAATDFATGVRTYTFMDVYDTWFNSEITTRLWEAAYRGNNVVARATRDNVIAGGLPGGVTIDDTARLMLDPRE